MKKNIRNRFILAACVGVLALSYAAGRHNGAHSGPAMRAFADNLSFFEDGSLCKLNQLTPWEWDSVYFVQPGTNEKQVEAILGFSTSAAVGDTANRSTGRMIFVKGQTVVQVLPFYSDDCSFILDAKDFLSEAKDKRDYLRFDADDPLTFCKQSRSVGSETWVVFSLNDEIDDYFYSFE